MTLKNIDDLKDKFQDLMDEAYTNYEKSEKFENRLETKYWLGVYQAYKNSFIISEELEANMDEETGVVNLKCETCGEVWKFDKRSAQARGTLRFDNCLECQKRKPLF